MRTIRYVITLLIIFSFTSCKEYLDVKPDEKLAVPSDKLQYLQLLLDDTGTMNQFYPAAGDLATDDAYIPDAQWPALLQAQKTSANAYIWEKDVFNEGERTDWATPYKVVFYANLVLEGLEKHQTKTGTHQWKELKGGALFFRSFAYFNLLQTFAKAYSSNTAKADPGIVLKLSSDINEKLSRASVQECYDRIISDLNEAKSLLPKTAEYKTRPTAAAASGLLARVYLVMQQYEKALTNAEEALAANADLIDYNTINTSVSYPFAQFNKEVIFHSSITALSGYSPTYGRVSTELYSMYQQNDLRRTAFYRISAGEVLFKGSYNGSNTRFNGISTNELYLIAAECYARTNDLTAALDRLNQLLIRRWKTGTFSPVNANSIAEGLNIILEERRKELAFRNIRWSDLKRLNLEPGHQKTITRVLNNKTYTLVPQDRRYAMPIPIKVIAASGIAQN